MTRRERASLVLALECLRDHAAPPGTSKAWRLGALTRVCADARLAAKTASHLPVFAAAIAQYADAASDYRTLALWRARLALALRVLLRVEAWLDGEADCPPGGRYECEDCGSRNYTAGFIAYMNTGDGRTRCDDCDSTRIEWTVAMKPLWESAKPHEVTR